MYFVNCEAIVNKKKSGRVVTVFLIIVVILLITGTAMALFFQQLEMRQRVSLEKRLDEIQVEKEVLQTQLINFEKQVFLLEDKNKEADERINSLLDELDLEKGLREEMRGETVTLRENLEKEISLKKEISDQLVKAKADYEKRVKEMEDKLRQEVVRSTELEVEMQKLKELDSLKANSDSASNETGDASSDNVATDISPSIDLDQIVVLPEDNSQGRVLSVDVETEFVIINLGRKNGIEEGQFLSIYRGSDYLGDVKVTRVQKEMSAADLIPPFSSKLVRHNDQVVIK